MIVVDLWKNEEEKRFEFPGWQDFDASVYVDSLGRRRLIGWPGEPLLHNPHGPTIVCDGEEPVYFLNGFQVQANRWDFVRPCTKPVEASQPEPSQETHGFDLGTAFMASAAVVAATTLVSAMSGVKAPAKVQA